MSLSQGCNNCQISNLQRQPVQQPSAKGMKYGYSCAAQQMKHTPCSICGTQLLLAPCVADFCLLQVQKEVPVQKVVEKVVEVSTVLLSAGQVM
jgi:hypothetical protein